MFEMYYCIWSSIHESKCSKHVITINIFHLNWFKLKITFYFEWTCFYQFTRSRSSLYSIYMWLIHITIHLYHGNWEGPYCMCQSIWFIEYFSVMNCISMHLTWSKFRILKLFPSLHSINTTSYWSRIRPIRLVQSHSCPIATQMKYYVTMGSQRT